MARVRRLIRAVRRRRDPATARTELLDAADRVFAKHTPEHAGLKVVAAEAGTSHALITHYFGTYRGLVEATLERRQAATRARVLGALAEPTALQRPDMLLGMLFESLADPVTLRLLRWLLGSEVADASTLGLANGGLRLVASRIAGAMPVAPSADKVERLELALLGVVASAFGWAIAKSMLAAAMGRTATRELDDAIRHTLAHMMQLYVRHEVGATG